MITENSMDISVTEGMDVTLSCTVNSVPTPSASWYRNGALVQESERVDVRPIDGDGLFEIMLSGVFVNDTDNYTCSFNNTVIPEVASATIQLTVTVLGKITPINCL